MATHTVLVVDDSGPLRRGIARGLVDPRLKLVFAEDLAGARAVLTRTAVSVLVADIELSDGDGFALVEEANRLAEPPAVLLISGAMTFQRVRNAAGLGAETLEKPFSAPQLRARLLALLGLDP